MSAKGGPVFTFGFPMGAVRPLAPVSYATANDLGQKCLNILFLWRHPQKSQVQNFTILLIQTRRLAASLERLNNSLASSISWRIIMVQSDGKNVAHAGLKGKSTRLFACLMKETGVFTNWKDWFERKERMKKIFPLMPIFNSLKRNASLLTISFAFSISMNTTTWCLLTSDCVLGHEDVWYDLLHFDDCGNQIGCYWIDRSTHIPL